MANLNHNKNLLNAISTVKKGNKASIVIKVNVTKSDKLIVENALNQWSLFFNHAYSSNYKCKENLKFSFKPVTRGGSDISFKGFKSTGATALARAIALIGRELGVHVYPGFSARDYIVSNNLIMTSKGVIIENGLVQDKKFRSAVFSAYGSPSAEGSVVYGVTNHHASNYNPEATKDDGTGFFPSAKSSRMYPNQMYTSRSANFHGSKIAVSADNYYLDLGNDFTAEPFSGSNAASTIPDTSTNTGDTFCDSAVITNAAGEIEMTLYKSKFGDFNISDRNGNLIKALDKNSGEATNIFRNTLLPINVSAPNEGFDKIGTSEIYSVTLSTGGNKNTMFLLTSPRERSYIWMDHSIPNITPEGQEAFDCNSPEDFLGNITESDVNFANPAANSKDGYLRTSDMFSYSGMLRSRRSAMEIVGGVDNYMIDPQAILEELLSAGTITHNSIVSLKECISRAGGSLGDFYFPYDRAMGLGVGQVSPAATAAFTPCTDETFTGIMSTMRQANTFADQVVRSIKTLPLIFASPPSHVNTFDGTSSRISGFEDVAQSLSAGVGDFSYVDNSTYGKGYSASFISFDIFTSQIQNISALAPADLSTSGYHASTSTAYYGVFSHHTESSSDMITTAPKSYVYGLVGGVPYYGPSMSTGRLTDHYSYIKGFSFTDTVADSIQCGIIRIAGQSWSSVTHQFTDTTEYSIVDPIITATDVVNPDEMFKLLSYCPIAMSFRKKDITGTYMSSPNNNPFSVMPDQPANTVGCYVVAYALLHGFVLMYMNEYGQFLPLVDSGVELHIPGGDISNVSVLSEGGYMPISMAFSPGDNYLYTIVKSKTSSEKYICIYDVSSIALGQTEADAATIVNSAVMINSPFAGDLSRVDRGSDGSIYFFSHNSTQYIKIDSADQSSSVSAFVNFPGQHVKNTTVNFDFLPSMSSSIELDSWLADGRHTVPSAEESILTTDVVILKRHDIPTYFGGDTLTGHVFKNNTLSASLHDEMLAYMIEEWPSAGTASPHETGYYNDLQLSSSTEHPYKIHEGGVESPLTLVAGNTYGTHFISIDDSSSGRIMGLIKTVSSMVGANTRTYRIVSALNNSNHYEGSEGNYASMGPILAGTYFKDIPNINQGGAAGGGPMPGVPYLDAGLPYAYDESDGTIINDVNAGATPFVYPDILGINNPGLWPGITGEVTYPAINDPTQHYYFFSISHISSRDINLLPVQVSKYFLPITSVSGIGAKNVGLDQFNIINPTEYATVGMGLITIEPSTSHWLVLLVVTQDQEGAKLRFNKIDSDFNVNDFSRDPSVSGFLPHLLSFSETFEYDLTSDLAMAAYSYTQTDFGAPTLDDISKMSFSVYSNITSSKLTIILNSKGRAFVMLYNFNKETGELTHIRTELMGTLLQRALGNTGAGNADAYTVPKKVVYNLNSSVLYILTASQEPLHGGHLNYLMKLDLTNIELTEPSAGLPQAFVEEVAQYKVPQFNAEGESLWPEEFSSDYDYTYPMSSVPPNQAFASEGSVRFVVDNIFMAKNGELYIASRKLKAEDFLGESEYPSIGKILNSTSFTDSVYALHAIRLSDKTYSEASGSLGDSPLHLQIKIKGNNLSTGGSTQFHSDAHKEDETIYPIGYNITGCMNAVTYLGTPNCNYYAEANVESACIAASNNGPADNGGTGMVELPNDPNYVECDCGESITPECSTCYDPATGVPDAGTTCGICKDQNALNYNATPITPGINLEDNTKCQYGACNSVFACDYFVSFLTPAPNGGTWVSGSEYCTFEAENCDCNNVLDEGYCGTCGGETYLQTGLLEEYCECGDQPARLYNLDLLPGGPSGILGTGVNSWSLFTDPTGVMQASYCDCAGNLPTTMACGCDNETVVQMNSVSAMIQGGLDMANLTFEQAIWNYYYNCNCEGETSLDLYGTNDLFTSYCGCDGNVNVIGACDCKNMPMAQYVDSDNDGIGVEPPVQLCPIVNEDGSLSAQPGYSFTGGDTSPTCDGEYDECGICRENGTDNPDYCHTGNDECGECCGNNECVDCHGVPNGPGATIENPCPGTFWCECVAQFLPDGYTCITDEGCGCGNGPVDGVCGTCEGPDANGCCDGYHYDDCRNECLPDAEPMHFPDLCGSCFKPNFSANYLGQTLNACVGCMDDSALNYNPESTVACVDCCEYETYVSPTFDMQPHTSGTNAPSSANLQSTLVALPSQFPANGLHLGGILLQYKFAYMPVGTALPAGWPECLATDNCTSVDTSNYATSDYIDNPSYSTKVQVLSKENYLIFAANPALSGESFYTTSSNISEGYLPGIQTVKDNAPVHSTFEVSDTEVGDYIINSIPMRFIPTSGTTANINVAPSGTSFNYSPKYYFTLDTDLELTTYDPSVLFADVATLIDKIVYYELQTPGEDGEESHVNLKNAVENALTPTPIVVFDPALNISIPLTQGSPYEGNPPITDKLLGSSISVTRVYVITVNHYTADLHHEFTHDLEPFKAPDEAPGVELCCLDCAPNSWTYIDPNSGNPVGAAPNIHASIIDGTHEFLSCNNTICEVCPDVDPCPGGIASVCCDTEADYYNTGGVAGDCEICNNDVCVYTCSEGNGCDDPLEVCMNQGAITFFTPPVGEAACCYVHNDNLCSFYVPIKGCTDPNACNYDPEANEENGDCIYPTEVVCNNSAACNYNSATDCVIIDNTTCIFPEAYYDCEGVYTPPDVYGCTDPLATNYNPLANIENGSCLYPTPPDPVITGWKIKAVIHSDGLTPEELSKFEWVIYDNNQNVVRVSPAISEYDSNAFGIHALTIDINNIMSVPCMWFLPLGVEKAEVWAHADLHILKPDGTIYHKIMHGFTLRDTGSILLSAVGGCALGCAVNGGVLTTEHCTVYIQEDTDDYTNITVQLKTPISDANVSYEGVVMRIVSIDDNKELVYMESLSADSVQQSSFIISVDTKIAIEYINPLGVNAPAEVKLIGEFGELITKRTLM